MAEVLLDMPIMELLGSSETGGPQTTGTEPEFVNLLRSPGIDSQPGGPIRQPYLTYRPAMLPSLAKSIPWNRFLGSLKVYIFGLSCTVGMEGSFRIGRPENM